MAARNGQTNLNGSQKQTEFKFLLNYVGILDNLSSSRNIVIIIVNKLIAIYV